MMRNSFAIIDFIIFEVSTNILSFRFVEDEKSYMVTKALIAMNGVTAIKGN